MINFKVFKAHLALSQLKDAEDIALREAESSESKFLDSTIYKAELEDLIKACREGFALLMSVHVGDRIDGFSTQVDYGLTEWKDLAHALKSLRETLETELKRHSFYHYPTEKAKKVKVFSKDWGGVLRHFPSVHDDAYAASDCYAMEQNTASVFHSMRVAELGLRALARNEELDFIGKQNIPMEWCEWGTIINQLKVKFDKRTGAMKRGPRKDAEVAFCSGSIAELESFRDEYRNVIMHVRASYDEYKALRALEKVRHFMGRLASRIDENGKRIRA